MTQRIFHCLTLMLSLTLSFNCKAEDIKLSVWINGDKGYNGLQAVGDKFTKDTGIKVEVSHPDKVTDKFQQAAAAGNGPDIFIWAHDRFGEWAKAGLIKEIKPSNAIKNSIADFAWDAVTYDNKLYGYPIAVEAISLIYNKDIIAKPPQTFEEIFSLQKTLSKDNKHAILWDYNNTYFTWPIFSAYGAYPFKKTSNGYDTSDTGVNNAGAIKAASLLKRLIDEGVMPEGLDYGVMESSFNKGQAAMIINGPWAWNNLEKSGINFGVAPLPRVENNIAQPFTGVLAATINAMGENQDLAVEFLEQYLLQIDGLRLVNNDVPLGAVANIKYMQELSSNPNIEATYQNAKHGNPMPNVSEMGRFWSAMEPALKNITAGRQAIKEALDSAAKRILQ